MALPDIKDTGALASILRFGWPWHGIIAGGVVGTTGHPHAQPTINDAYLIDIGLPAPDLTPEKIASEAAAGREWRNYALLPHGTVYNKSIGDSSFIHIDEAGKPWRIDLAFSFPASQTLRITADITEFGVLEISTGPATAVTIQKTVDVVCTEIELANVVDTYSSRYGHIEDVYTNGSKALIGVLLVMDSSSSHDLFSVVTLTLSGEGGETGSGLVLNGAETIAQPALTVGNEADVVLRGYLRPAIASTGSSDCPVGQTWEATYSVNPWASDWLTKRIVKNIQTYARYAFFSAVGDPIAIRLRMGSENTITYPPAVYSLSYYSAVYDCQTPGTLPGLQGTWTHLDDNTWGVWLLENETVVDSVLRTRLITKNFSWDTDVDGEYPTNQHVVTPDSETTVWSDSGSLATYLPPGTVGLPTMPLTLAGFRKVGVGVASAMDNMGSSVFIGIDRMNSKATAFVAQTPTEFVYGVASTPLGNLTVGLTPSLTTNFAWQRKTGEHSFASSPICYV